MVFRPLVRSKKRSRYCQPEVGPVAYIYSSTNTYIYKHTNTHVYIHTHTLSHRLYSERIYTYFLHIYIYVYIRIYVYLYGPDSTSVFLTHLSSFVWLRSVGSRCYHLAYLDLQTWFLFFFMGFSWDLQYRAPKGTTIGWPRSRYWNEAI